MRRRFGDLLVQALLEQNPDVARDAYELTEFLPQTATERALSVDGYIVSGNFNARSDSFTVLFKGWNCYMLKSMTYIESSRATELLQSMGDLKKQNIEFVISNLTSFDILHISNKYFMIMPHYVFSLDVLPKIAVELGIDLYNQMARALEFLHGMPEHYNHMDIKPSNICAAGNGLLVLIDLGSVVKLGEKSESTQAYVPRDFQMRSEENPLSNVYVAGKSNDWWMLAMTIAEKVYELPVGYAVTEPPLMSDLKIILGDEIWVDLVNKLHED